MMVQRVFRWPIYAIVFWGVAWLIHYALLSFNITPAWVFAATLSISLLLSMAEKNQWRRLFLNGGFIASWLLTHSTTGLAQIPAWLWLLPMGILLLSYPIQSWSDAPFFPTPDRALHGLGRKVPLKNGAKILDAGCGLGHGLKELRKEYPESQLYGIERSALLAHGCAMLRRWATIERGDIWLADWSGYDMVYIFQRPESMKNTLKKVNNELKPKTWLVSLEFELVECIATEQLTTSNGKMVWLYQMPLKLKKLGELNV
jgi:hypothetical protein